MTQGLATVAHSLAEALTSSRVPFELNAAVADTLPFARSLRCLFSIG